MPGPYNGMLCPYGTMEITLKNLQKKFPIPRAKVIRVAKAALVSLRAKRSNLSIVFVGARRMAAINKKYLKHDYATDVLTFDLGDGAAEIIICPAVAALQAKAHQTSTADEIILYVIHGILHLAGYDDHGEKDRKKMRRMESVILRRSRRILRCLKILRPKAASG